MRADDVSLADILLAAERITVHLQGISRSAFLQNRTVQAAVEREISIIGEAAGRVSPEFMSTHTELPWKRLVQLRNFYMHAYERLDAREVWATATRLIPRIKEQLTLLIPSPEEPVDPSDDVSS